MARVQLPAGASHRWSSMYTFEIVSQPGTTDTIELDHRIFPFAGKFGQRQTGTAVLKEDDSVVAALSFSPDRNQPHWCRIRYLAVARDRQGEELASRLAEQFVEWCATAGFEQLLITVLNPYLVVSLARVGFGFTGENGPTGGVILAHPFSGDLLIVEAMRSLAEHTSDERHRRYAQRYVEKLDPAGDDL